MSIAARRLQRTVVQSVAQPPVVDPPMANGDTLNTHAVMVDSSNKVVSWVAVQDQSYAEVSRLSWEYLLTSVPVSSGKPGYYSHSYMDPNTQSLVGWPHNPAGLYGMLIESALRYYQFSGDGRVLQVAEDVATHHLTNGMTLVGDNWSRVPYASGDAGSLTYRGASYGNSTGVGDGVGVIQTDKIAELCFGFVQLYKLSGTQAYLDAAINGANQLVSHVRTGTTNQSPWPYRVVAQTGAIKEQYCSNLTPFFELFDSLIELGVGNVSGYQATRTSVWNWMMTYPMQNNYWSAYFEDVDFQSSPNSNLNQLNAMMVARYLLNHPEKDSSWESHVRGLISWVESTFGGQSKYGARLICEQQVFFYAMGSHTSRYASVNALLYEKTGDIAAKEKAYRSFNWSTYMARSNGVVIDGPQVNNQWFTDGYGDFVRHFMVGMGAIPAFAPNGQRHILATSSLVKSVTYGANSIVYQTFDTTGIEKLKLDQIPSSITVDGVALPQRSDLTAEGWLLNAADSSLQIRRETGGSVIVTLSGAPVNQAPSVTITAPANGLVLQAPANVTIAANVSDPEGGLDRVEFYQNGVLLGSDSAAPFTIAVSNLPVGVYSFSVKAYDSQGVSTTAVSTVSVGSQTAGWTNVDIGTVGVAGSSSVTNGVYTVHGSGIDIWDTSDSFNLNYTTMTGDGEIFARVVSQQNTNEWALAGVMIRASLNVNSQHVLAGVTPSHSLSFDSRSTAGGVTTYTAGGGSAAPYWVRLTRQGNLLTAYRSADGATWTSIASITIATMPATAYVGLAVVSCDNATLGTVVFDNVFVTGAVDTIAPLISNVSAGTINGNGGSISWTTNELATSQIEYGTTTSYGFQTSVNSTLETSHTQVVAGLLPSTLYHYRVKSSDAAGNSATSSDATFTTQGA